jgi:hypothetical protein
MNTQRFATQATVRVGAIATLAETAQWRLAADAASAAEPARPDPGATDDRSLIDESNGHDRPLWVVFPSAAYVPNHWRHVVFVALIQGDDGGVTMLRIDRPWTPARLSQAVAFFCGARRQNLGEAQLAALLASTLEVPAVTVSYPVLDAIDLSPYDLRQFAITSFMAQNAALAPSLDVAVVKSTVEVIEQHLDHELRSAIGRFRGRLDGDVLAALAAQPDLDSRAYNYLAVAAGSRRRNRLQFAQTFPLLLSTAARATATGRGAQLAQAIDAGVPLVATLARSWGVAPSTLRCLRGVLPATAGATWTKRLHALLKLLDALPAAARPINTVESWARFNDAVGAARRVFGERANAALPIAWLSRRKTTAEVQVSMPAADARVLASIDALRGALREAMHFEAALLTGSTVDFRFVAQPQIDRFLAGFSLRRLQTLAAQFHRELIRAPVAAADDRGVSDGRQFLALLPHDHIGASGKRRVTCLVTPAQLRLHGRVLEHCLGHSHLDYFATRCAQGLSFIVAVLDGETGCALSTAELQRPSASLVSASIELRIAQHNARRNRPPTPECRQALDEVLALAAARTGQNHLASGLRAIALWQRSGAHPEYIARCRQLSTAVRTTIGAARYDAMVNAVARTGGR